MNDIMTTEVETVRNRVMVLITKEQHKKLLKAGYQGNTPIIKLFMGCVTWLVTGIEDGILYGWGDIGQGCVEWGSLISVEELKTLKVGPAYIERDRWFKHDPAIDYSKLDTLVGI